ncbi:MAG: hypothetical protein H7175_01285 [Burkholderiales bacterium]|nr:hypothetical protein [Anaerolineae bacterium]
MHILNLPPLTTTGRLWKALQIQPIHHPLYRRTQTALSAWLRLDGGFLPFIYIFLVLIACTIIALITIELVQRGGFILGLLLVLLIFFGSARHGLLWSMQISHFIADEYERGTFPLLSTAPTGAFGASWTICTAVIHSRDRVHEWGVQHVALTRSALSMWVVVLLIFLWMSRVISLGSLLDIPVAMLAVIAVYFLDGKQSIVLGCLLGMLIPMYSRSRNDARLLSMASFLALQIATYLLAWMFAAFILPMVAQRSGFEATASSIFQAAFGVGLFYVLREAIIRVLWLRLIAQLNVSAAEIENTIHAPLYQTSVA